MLKEQRTSSRDTRWFVDDELELFIWSAGGEITGYQLCYDRLGAERCITFRSDGAVEYHGVDSGEDRPTHNRSPVLTTAIHDAPPRKLLDELRNRGRELPRDIVDDLIRRLATVISS